MVFLVGLTLTTIGFLYSWKPVRLKSIPVMDLIGHVICLGVLQFSTTYFAFRTFDLLFISLLMIVVPFSLITEIFHELSDFKVDKKTKIKNTIQRIGLFNIKKVTGFLGIIITVGFTLLFYNIYPSIIIILISPLFFLGTIMYINSLFKYFTKNNII